MLRTTFRRVLARGALLRTPPPPCARARTTTRAFLGGGHGIKGMEGFLKQEKLREKVEQMHDARAKAEKYLSKRQREEAEADGASSTARHDAGHPPPWEAPPPPMGVAAMAEAKIEAAMRDGVMENLEGRGKPLATDHSTETPWDADAGQAALNRVLKTAGYKPASVERLDEVKARREAMARTLAAAAAAADASGSASGSGAADVTKGAGVELAFREYEESVKKYNLAVISDKETHGQGWPMRPMTAGTLESHAAAAAALAKKYA